MNFQLFISTFILIFIAELPDKTAFASLILATQNNPWSVFIGAAGAFVVQSLVAVLFGSLFGLLPHSAVQMAAGVLFLIFAVLMWRRKDDDEDGEKDGAGHKKTFWKSAWKSFVVIFIAEWGDLTQLATATLVAKHGEPLTLFVAATSALWVVTALAVLIGNRMKSFIKPAVLQKVAAVAFVAVGIYMLVDAFKS